MQLLVHHVLNLKQSLLDLHLLDGIHFHTIWSYSSFLCCLSQWTWYA